MGRRSRKAPAAALLALLLNAAIPVGALAQSGDYSGSASGAVADVQLPSPGFGPPVHTVFGESTGAVNSQAGIIPDVPSTQADETQDFAVGTATPVRATFQDQRHNPGSVQSSAPENAGGSFDVVGPGTGTGLSAGHAETSSQAAADASTASTDNTTNITNGRFSFHLPLHVPTGSSTATVERAANGEVTAIGQAQLGSGPPPPGGGSAQPISAFGGYITAAAIEATSTSTADGAGSGNTIGFRIRDLRLLSAPGATEAYITANADPGPGDTVLLNVTIAVPNTAPVNGVIVIPRGSNLLSGATYAGSTTLAPAFSTLTPYLSQLTTAPTGQLSNLELILAAGYSDDGDGTYARGLVEAVKMSITVNGFPVAHTFGRAYSAADAERAFSTATDPALPPDTTPTSNAAAAFPETRTASPTELAFASDAQPPEPVSTPVPAPSEPGEEPVDDSPDQQLAEQPVPASNQPAEVPVAEVPVAEVAGAVAEGSSLPFTGLDVTAVAGLGLLLLTLGGIGRRLTRRPALPPVATQS